MMYTLVMKTKTTITNQELLNAINKGFNGVQGQIDGLQYQIDNINDQLDEIKYEVRKNSQDIRSLSNRIDAEILRRTDEYTLINKRLLILEAR